MRHGSSLLAISGLFFAAAGCVKQNAAETQSSTGQTENQKDTGNQTIVSACDDPRNSFTQTDDWTLRYFPKWAREPILVGLGSADDPNSVFFSHLKEDLANSEITSSSSCYDASKGTSKLTKTAPVVAGVNLFNKGQPGCPGGKVVDGDFRYVFMQYQGKKHIAVSKGAEGCSDRNFALPGNCFIWGVVEDTKITLTRNSCVGGYLIYDRIQGLKSKPVCGTNQNIDQGGQVFPQGFVLIREPTTTWAQSFGCQAPKQPPIVVQTAFPTVAPTAISSPSPIPTGGPGTKPTPPKDVVTPIATPTYTPTYVPTPIPSATPVIVIPKPNCNPWIKKSCYDGWVQQGPNPTEQIQIPPYPQIHPHQGRFVPGTQQQEYDPTKIDSTLPGGNGTTQIQNPTPVPTFVVPTVAPERPIWYKKK
jgi:hypothetical protein